MKRIKVKLVYEIFMMILALTVVILTLLDITIFIKLPKNNFISITNAIIYAIFVIDFVVRLVFSKNKWSFITHNKIDFLTIIPYGAFLKIFSFFKVLKFIKVLQLSKFTIGMVYFENFLKKLFITIKTNNITIVVLVILSVIFAGAGSIAIVENIKFTDALWWSFVTATTVGYGDISPKSHLGRVIAVILMITGVVSTGVLSGIVATYFLKREIKNNVVSRDEDAIIRIKEKLDNFWSLSEEEIDEIHNIMEALKRKKNN